MKNRPFRIWYVILTGFTSIFIAFWVTITYVNHVSEQRRIDTCRVVLAQLEVFEETPPSTPTGVKAREAWRGLQRSLTCTEAMR
jgi:hypothetical protein